MSSASKHSTQVMTSQDFRDWEANNAPGQEKLPQQPASAKTKLPKTESPEAKSPDFLRLTPSNTKAKRAFSELLERKKGGTLSPHHAQYIVDSGKGPLRKTINYQTRSKSETPDEECSDEPEASEIINLGFFKVSFGYENVTDSAKWVMGRGSERRGGDNKIKRNVDILLAAPNSKFSKGLLAAHAYLKMHPDSGVWMIHAAPDPSTHSEGSAPKAIAMLDEHEIFHNGFRCLHKPEACLSILGMDFHLQFALTTYSACERYRDLRNRKLKEHDVGVPDTGISGIPLETDIRARNLAVFSLGLGSGTFGSVYEAFDPVSGELRIVKVIEVKSESAAKSLKIETDMVKRHPNARGLVRQYGWSNSNGEPTLEAKKYPFNIYIVQKKGNAFYKHFQPWSPASLKERLKLCQDLLHGLYTIHAGGGMHRDITPMNILYFKGDPSEAALCDFGKLCFRKTANNTALAAWKFLPPEIVEGHLNIYNQSIDIWMLALSLVMMWFPQASLGVPCHHNGQIAREGLGAIRVRLEAVKEDHCLANLLWHMLSDNPNMRPTPKKALEHPCFRRLKPDLPQEAESSKGKRRHLDEASIDIDAAKEQALRLG